MTAMRRLGCVKNIKQRIDAAWRCFGKNYMVW
jgi:hypothetical protein